jgi:non-ribosomal peptide synthetase component E (peptide arylation enzyme)
VAVKQSDTAAVLYSSGTTGRVKAVAISHRNLIATICSHRANREKVEKEAAEAGEEPPPPTVTLLPLPLFHVFGFMMLLRSVAMGETAVLMERFDFGAALRAIERYRVTLLPAAPPVLVAMIKSEEARRRDLSSLLVIGIGGAPLGREVAERFAAIFPGIELVQVPRILHKGSCAHARFHSESMLLIPGLRSDGVVWIGGCHGRAGRVQGLRFGWEAGIAHGGEDRRPRHRRGARAGAARGALGPWTSHHERQVD